MSGGSVCMRSTRVAGHMCVCHVGIVYMAASVHWPCGAGGQCEQIRRTIRVLGEVGETRRGGWQSVAIMCIDVLCTLTRTRPSHARGEVCTQYLSASVNFECSYMRSLARHQVGNPPIPAHDTYSMYICVSYAGARVRPPSVMSSNPAYVFAIYMYI